MRRQVLIPVVVVLASAAAALTAPWSATASPVPHGPHVDHMGVYRASDYAGEAQLLPQGVSHAVRRDLGISPAQYLAEAAAGADAARIVQQLKAAGVDVRNARLRGTSLVVSVGPAGVAAAEAAGALVDDAPAPNRHAETRRFSPDADVNDGSGWAWTADGSEYTLCSVGFVGYRISTGTPETLSAGHCFAGISQIQGPVSTLVMPTAGDIGGASLGPTLGSPVASGNQFGNGYDAGLLTTDAGVTQKPAALTWGNGSGAPLASAPLPVFDVALPITGGAICKSGIRTGWTCGHVSAVDTYIDFTGGQTVSEMVSDDLCSREGDSGGAVMEGFSAIAIVSGSTSDNCSASGYASVAFELRSPGGYQSVQDLYPDWEPQVTVPTPSVTAPAPGGIATVLMTSANDGHASSQIMASISFDGGAAQTVLADHNAVAYPLSSLTPGEHTYTLRTLWGSWSTSAQVSGSFRNVNEGRTQGADRFINADLIAKAAYASGASTVYLTNGLNYPDALGAGPAAMRDHAPILLTMPDSLPSDVASTLQDLNPSKVVVLGGVNSVSAAVVQQVGSTLPSASVVRLGGADRFDASRHLISSTWDTAPTVFITNGLNFPDALSAGPAAHTIDAPLLLVNGPASSLPSESLALLQQLGTTRVVIAGGPASVSPGIESQLDGILGAANVVRLGGADRYEASVNINAAYFSSADGAFLATGEKFPDALAGGAWAGSLGEPMYTVHHDCIPAGTSQAIAHLGVNGVQLLGGTATLTDGVSELAAC